MTQTGQLIVCIKDFAKHPYAWPGGYTLFAITSDGAALCHACVKLELKNVVTAVAQGLRDGWMVTDITVNWEDNALYCDHCNRQIEVVYSEA